MSSSAEYAPRPHAAPHVAAEKQVRQQGVPPITSVDELAFPGVRESGDELGEFLVHLHASRHAYVPSALYGRRGIDFQILALVIFSSDNDLVPAVKLCFDLPGPAIEVACYGATPGTRAWPNSVAAMHRLPRT
jgi:hypothetical protein